MIDWRIGDTLIDKKGSLESLTDFRLALTSFRPQKT